MASDSVSIVFGTENELEDLKAVFFSKKKSWQRKRQVGDNRHDGEEVQNFVLE